MSVKKNKDLLFIENLINEFGGMGRLGITFETPKGGYFYDNGTGKVMSCEPHEFQFISWLSDSQKNYEELESIVINSEKDDFFYDFRILVEQENLFQAPYIKEFQSTPHKKDVDTMLDSELRLITLELTENCNLRCSYCVYGDNYSGDRNFSDMDMSKETVKMALNFFAKHSCNDIAVSLYGGEPLLKYGVCSSLYT